MTEKSPANRGTISEPIERNYPKLIVEAGKVYSLNTVGGVLKEIKEYWVGYGRRRGNPVTIGREAPEPMQKRDIIIDKKYQSVSREHAEIYFNEEENSFFLVDYSLNGTLINGKRVGGKRVPQAQKLKHEDLIQIPPGPEKVALRFLMHERKGIKSWIKG
jgi:hypothetical protein